MTSNTTTQTKKQDNERNFSHYKWFPGENAKYDAVSLSTFEGRVFVGVKGWDRKRNGPGYI